MSETATNHWSDIKLTVGGGLDLPDEIWELKATSERRLDGTKLTWSITVLAANEQEATVVLTEVRRQLSTALLDTIDDGA